MKLAICGFNGFMGKMVAKESKKFNDIEVVAGIDTKVSDQDFGFKVVDSFKKIENIPEVIIDFSNPQALSSLLEYAMKNNVSLVICTTGFSDDQVEKIKFSSQKIPIFFSGNMSLGINVLIKLAKQAAKLLGDDFDIEIIEKHHKRKIDAPSGTALMIADEVSNEKKEDILYSYDRHSKSKPRGKNEIGIHSIRGGNIVGDHEILFAGEHEVVKISHHAQSREIFAQGALKAALYLKGKSPGLYNMNDMI